MMQANLMIAGKTALESGIPDYVSSASRLADSRHFDAVDEFEESFPRQHLTWLVEEGMLSAAMPLEWGGSGLGSTTGSHILLLELLKEIGRADLSLGRIYEGHVNAIQLIHAYGTSEQQANAAADCLSGKLFAVWNTDSAEVVRMDISSDGSWELRGRKAFASAAGWADRPLVMAERGSEGRQICLLRREEMRAEIDPTSWRPMGMAGTESYQIDLTGTRFPESAVIGRPGDYYAAPLFRGGSIRTSALLMGGAEALFRYLRTYLKNSRQTHQPLQQFRMARIYATIESGRGWLRYAAQEAEAGLYGHADNAVAQRMNFAANATRVAVEDICPQVVRLVSEGVGARGLLQPFRFGQVIRDLTMFLRQPNLDDCLLETGRYLLEGTDSNV